MYSDRCGHRHSSRRQSILRSILTVFYVSRLHIAHQRVIHWWVDRRYCLHTCSWLQRRWRANRWRQRSIPNKNLWQISLHGRTTIHCFFVADHQRLAIEWLHVTGVKVNRYCHSNSIFPFMTFSRSTVQRMRYTFAPVFNWSINSNSSAGTPMTVATVVFTRSKNFRWASQPCNLSGCQTSIQSTTISFLLPSNMNRHGSPMTVGWPGHVVVCLQFFRPSIWPIIRLIINMCASRCSIGREHSSCNIKTLERMSTLRLRRHVPPIFGQHCSIRSRATPMTVSHWIIPRHCYPRSTARDRFFLAVGSWEFSALNPNKKTIVWTISPSLFICKGAESRIFTPPSFPRCFSRCLSSSSISPRLKLTNDCWWL